jgi:glucosylceramidase
MFNAPPRLSSGAARRLGAALLCLHLPAALAATASAQTVRVWITTSDRSATLEEAPSVAFSGASRGGNVVVIDERETYQEIEGFGASFTDAAAYLLNQVATPVERDAAMRNLFTREGTGIGVSFVRNPMGASDLARFHYSYADAPADPALSGFSIAHDQADIIPLMLLARQLNPQLTVMASPWSPPGWMKDSGAMIGGSLLPNRYDAFARYFVKYIQAYEAAGIPIHYISLQNEPLYVPPNYPGMFMDAGTQTAVLRDHVLPALSDAGVRTKVLIYDHNWDRPDYPETVLGALGGSSRIAGVAWHGYGGIPSAMSIVRDKYPDAGHHVTELSGGTWVANQVKDDFETIMHAVRNWAKSFVKWSLALDQTRGPHAGGCDTCSPLVTVDTTTGTVAYAIDYFTLGHFSKFVLPGAVRIYSSNAPGVITAAFANPDGSRALVAFNGTPSTLAFEVHWGSASFSHSMSGLSGATFVWSGAQSGDSTLNARSRIMASGFHAATGLQTETTTDTLGGYNVGYADEGDHAVYRNVDFGARVSVVDVRVASGGGGGTLDLRLDAPDGPLISTVRIPATGGWQQWRTVTAPVVRASGRHDLYLVFRGGTAIANVNWFRFR